MDASSAVGDPVSLFLASHFGEEIRKAIEESGRGDRHTISRIETEKVDAGSPSVPDVRPNVQLRKCREAGKERESSHPLSPDPKRRHRDPGFAAVEIELQGIRDSSPQR